jgi:hypothetical protein
MPMEQVPTQGPPSNAQQPTRYERMMQRRGDAEIICPQCQVRGRVWSKPTKQKKGVSGGKATAAVFTFGVSMLGTGLSRKEKVTELHCGNCGSKWFI